MKQIYAKNTDYEILTPHGWENFEGIFCNISANKPSRKVIFSNGTSITATVEHRFFINGIETKVADLQIGDSLDSSHGMIKIVNFEDCVLVDTYEIFNATNHVIIANEIYSHQCDEFAFVRPTIAREFWTSISPTLSTGGKAIVTSTPNSDEDQFATIWKNANYKFDEYGNETKVGKNGFAPIMFPWSLHPERDETWESHERASIGDDRFDREHDCIVGSSLVKILLPSGEICEISIQDLSELLSL